MRVVAKNRARRRIDSAGLIRNPEPFYQQVHVCTRNGVSGDGSRIPYPLIDAVWPGVRADREPLSQVIERGVLNRISCERRLIMNTDVWRAIDEAPEIQAGERVFAAMPDRVVVDRTRRP